jgi:hypothetical protein
MAVEEAVLVRLPEVVQLHSPMQVVEVLHAEASAEVDNATISHNAVLP